MSRMIDEETFDDICYDGMCEADYRVALKRFDEKSIDAEPMRHGHWIMEAIMPKHATDTVKVIGRCSECGCYDAICHADALGYYKNNPIIWAGFIINYKGDERLAEEFALTKAGSREKNRYCPNCGARMNK